MSNHFKIIVPFYNVEKWIGNCIKSIKLQNYENYQCIVVDDMSTDDSYENAKNAIGDDDRFTLIKNDQKKYALRNIYDAITLSGTNPEDVIVTLDGDDWFSSKNSLSMLDNEYAISRCLLTYGSYIEYPSMQRGKFCNPIKEEIVRNNIYRKSKWVSSHLRTFKRHLWDRIDIKDLQDENGDFYRMTWDMAFMFPMLEMAGPLACHIENILYCYNRQNPLNDDKVNHNLQLNTESYIRNKDPYPKSLVQGDILGPSGDMSGIGNQLFCVASVLATSYENNTNAFFPQINHNPYIKKYKELFYKDLLIGRSGDFYDNIYAEKDFSYNEIKIGKGITRIHGYFQSYRYFDTHREKILKDLNISELKKMVEKKYGSYQDRVSIHVRRGDYLELKEYHHNLDMDYYKSSISKFDENTKFVIFSNDLQWCKENFNFLKNVTFSPTEDDWEDIILMSMCRDNIIANSSFSWWGAWLNENEEKIVICPRKWFGPKYSHKDTKDLFPKEWIVL